MPSCHEARESCKTQRKKGLKITHYRDSTPERILPFFRHYEDSTPARILPFFRHYDDFASARFLPFFRHEDSTPFFLVIAKILPPLVITKEADALLRIP